MLKERAQALWAKIQENKDTVIKVTAIVTVAAVGAIVTAMVIKAQNDEYLPDDSVEELLELDEMVAETDDAE